MTLAQLLAPIAELANEHIEYVEASGLEFHAGGDTRLAQGALRLIQALEVADAALEFECGNRCAEQNPCNAKDARAEIERILEGVE